MKKKFTHENYEWSVNGLVNCISENNLKSELIYYTETSAIVHVVSYEDSQILGAESDWCISQHKESWKKYVEDTKGIQLFFYCFNQPVTSDYGMYGATFLSDGKSANMDCCFTKHDNPIKDALVYDNDESAIAYVLKKDFGNLQFYELIEEILYIFYDLATSKENDVFEEKTLIPYLDYYEF